MKSRTASFAVLIMRLLKQACEAEGPSFNHMMLCAAACTCYFDFLRAGEATVPSLSAYDSSVHLSISDISIDSRVRPTSVAVRIKASKTDPFRAGVDVHLGRTDKDM